MPGPPPVPGAPEPPPGTAAGEPGAPPGVVVGVVGVVVVGVAAAHVGRTKRSLINVTAPVRASARPCTVTLPLRLIDVSARMLPRKTEPVPRGAGLPIFQNALPSCAPV